MPADFNKLEGVPSPFSLTSTSLGEKYRLKLKLRKCPLCSIPQGDGINSGLNPNLYNNPNTNANSSAINKCCTLRSSDALGCLSTIEHASKSTQFWTEVGF